MKNIFLFIALLVTVSTGSFAQKKPVKEKKGFVCAPCNGGCDTTTYSKPGKCPHCGMDLVEKATLKTAKDGKPITACFYLQDNVELLDFAGPMEVFRVAGFTVFTVSKTKNKINSEGSLTIIPDYSIEDAPPSNLIVFFGGAHSVPQNDPAVISWIQSRKSTTDYYMSVCTGAFILGKAGLLDNLTATTYHTQIKDLQKALPKTKVLSNVRFVDNGNVISTAGISAGIDGALHFVAKIQGAAFAKQVAANIEYDKWVPGQGLIIKENNAKPQRTAVALNN